MPERAVNITLPSTRVVIVLLGSVAVLLVAMHVVAEASGLEILESHWLLGSEATVPTWWSSAQLGVLAFLLWCKARQYEGVSSSGARAFNVAAAVSLFFSIDEVATVHESITGLLERFEAVPRFAGEHGIWILVYGFVGIVLIVVLMPGLVSIARTEPVNSSIFAAGAAMFLAGGVGIEIIGYFAQPMVLLEESLEIIGVAVMLLAGYRSVRGIDVGFPNGHDEGASIQAAESP